MALDRFLWLSEAHEMFVAGVTTPVAAMWPRLTPEERVLVEHVVWCQLAAMGVRVEKKTIPPAAPALVRHPAP